MSVVQFSALSDGHSILFNRASTRVEVVSCPHAGKDITLLLSSALFQPQFRSQHGSD